MAKTVITQQLCDEVKTYREGHTQRETAGEFSISQGTVNNIMRGKVRPIEEFIAPNALPADHPKPDLGNLKSRSVNVLKMLGDLADRTEAHNTGTMDYHKVAIKTNQPIAVMKAADLHMGGMDVAYRALAEHYEFLLKQPRFYLQLFGDDINLMIMHKVVGARHDILTPTEQVKLIEGMVDQLVGKGKLISMGWGNHSDEFTERTAGFGIVKLLCDRKVPYFRGLGYLDLQVGKQIYPMAFAHKVRFHSFMNALHGNKRMQQCHADFFGVNRPMAREYITGHTHNPACSTEGALPKERVHFIKCGTFKTNDIYSQRFFGQGRIGVPTVVYHPNEFRHVLFTDPWEAYRYMTGRDWKR